jgi:three-Cys-motif partner protein
MPNNFGGRWTQDKLNRLNGYLNAYMSIMKSRTFFRKVYVDAFAGTGQMELTRKEDTSGSLTFPELEDQDVVDFYNGSARVALETDPSFDHYLFIEKSARKCEELETLKVVYSQQASKIQIENADANQFMLKWIQETNWKKTRAVVFLDPFGMQVEWTLIEAIADTKAIDLWLLVPLSGINRVLKNRSHPPEEWSNRLTKFFGTEDWKEEFYENNPQIDLFGNESSPVKSADFNSLKTYLNSRLQKPFVGVAKNPLVLVNSKNFPLFLLCFAVGNTNGKEPALRIAQHLLREDYGH